MSLSGNSANLRRFSLPLSLIVLLVLAVSCQGPAGPDGQDAVKLDILGPEIQFATPLAGSQQFADTLQLRAELTGESSDFLNLRFLVNGETELGGDTLWADPATLSRTIDLLDAGVDYGLVLLGAVSSDTAGNLGYAPEVLIRYVDPTAPLELAPGDLTGTLETFAVPDTIALTVDTVDTGWAVDGIAVAMVAPTDIALDSLELLLRDTPTGYVHEAALNIGVAPSTGSGPAATSDTIRFTLDAFSYGSETIIDLSTLRGDSARVTFAEEDTFFVLLSPELPDTLTGDNRFTEVGTELAVLLRDGDLIQPGVGDLWLHESSSASGSWFRLSSLLDTPWYYPRVRLYASIVEQAPAKASTTTAGKEDE